MTKREDTPLKRHIEESPRLRALREKRHKRRMRILIAITCAFLLLVAAFVYVSRLSRFALDTVVVSGNKVVDTEDVTSRVESKLAGHYAYFIPHRNAFLYPKQKILADIATAFPRFQTVSIYRTDLHTVLVTVTEIRGRALWCGSDVDHLGPDTPCYFTDESGKIVSDAPYYSGNVYPRFFGGVLPTNGATPIGTSFVDQATFENLLAFETRVQALGFAVKGIVVGDGDEDSFSIDLSGGKTAPIRFLKKDDFQILSGNLSAALGNAELKSAVTSNKANLEYFDLRFTNKVYYKFSDGK